MRKLLLFCVSLCLVFPLLSQEHPWLEENDSSQYLHNRIDPPPGFFRTGQDSNSFGFWLRKLPLYPGRPEVFLFDGRKKWNQRAHEAVINMDVGDRDLQQCADAVIRLRAEYLRSQSIPVHFNFTSGDTAKFDDWAKGYRPQIQGNRVNWRKTGRADTSYAAFKSYLRSVFTYAGTYSLSKELISIKNIYEIEIGDVFIQGGFPGHAVLVVDVAEDPVTGEKAFLLAQSYMPAQQMHILRNPQDSNISPWYFARPGQLITPEWTFPSGCHKRFK
jgi:hypothetical protein